MHLDDTRFPLVYADADLDSPLSFREQFELILGRQRPFVIITDHPPGEHAETPDERREKALMFKQIKDRMRTYCRGMIIIMPDGALTSALQLAATTAAKGLGFTIQFAVDEAVAQDKAERLLA